MNWGCQNPEKAIPSSTPAQPKLPPTVEVPKDLLQIKLSPRTASVTVTTTAHSDGSRIVEDSRESVSFTLHNGSEFYLSEVTIEILEYDDVVLMPSEQPERSPKQPKAETWDFSDLPDSQTKAKSYKTKGKKYRQTIQVSPLTSTSFVLKNTGLENLPIPEAGPVSERSRIRNGYFAGVKVVEAQGWSREVYEIHNQALSTWISKYGEPAQISPEGSPSP